MIKLHFDGEEERKKSRPGLVQKMAKVLTIKDGELRGKSVRCENGLILRVVEGKPYVVGVQAGTVTHFFDEFCLKDLQREG